MRFQNARFLHVIAQTALRNLPVLQRHPAKGHEELAVFGDGLPARGAGQMVKKAAQHMRYDHLGSGIAVGVHRAGEPTDAVQKPFHLALRMVEPPGAGPAIRPGIDRLIAVFAAHPVKLSGDQTARLGPADRHKGILAALVSGGARPALKPAFPDHRLRNPGRCIQHIDDALPNGRRITVFLESAQSSHPTALAVDTVGTPMAGSQQVAFQIVHALHP